MAFRMKTLDLVERGHVLFLKTCLFCVFNFQKVSWTDAKGGCVCVLMCV